MKSGARLPHGTLALRRAALLTECELQRLSLAAEAKDLLMPLDPDNLRNTLGTRLKIPLMVAGGALGLLISRPRRIMPKLLAAASLWKSAGAVLPLVRRVAALARR